MIPYYRHVRDTDDGCGICECLACRGTWEWRGGSGKITYCMYCGIRFAGKLECRDQDQPRWQYELQQRLGNEDYWPIERRWWDSLRRKPEPYWVLEERVTLLRLDGSVSSVGEWRHVRPLFQQGRGVPAHEAYVCLKEVRHREAVRDTPEDEDYDPDLVTPLRMGTYEYRLRRQQPDGKAW